MAFSLKRRHRDEKKPTTLAGAQKDRRIVAILASFVLFLVGFFFSLNGVAVNYLTDEFSFWTRGGVQQACLFISRTVVGHTELGKVQTVTPEGSKEFDPNTVLTDFVSHVIVQPNKLAISAVTSKNYPRRVIFEVMRDIATKFEAAQPNWASKAGTDTQIEFPYMIKICKSYEDPRKSDNILKIQGQLDETKELMMKNIDQILHRGETIEELVQRTDDLEMSSKVFFQVLGQRSLPGITSHLLFFFFFSRTLISSIRAGVAAPFFERAKTIEKKNATPRSVITFIDRHLLPEASLSRGTLQQRHTLELASRYKTPQRKPPKHQATWCASSLPTPR